MDLIIIYAMVFTIINVIGVMIYTNMMINRVGEFIAEINEELAEWKIKVRKEYAILNYLNSDPIIINDE